MDYQHKKIKSIKQQIGKYYSLNSKLIKQNKIKQEELDITLKQYQRDSSFLAEKTISLVDFEKSKNTLLQEKYAFENTKTAIDNSGIQILQLEQNVLDLQQQFDEQKKQFELSIEQSYNNLNNQIKTWEQTYLIIAPINGTVTFNLYWSENQNVVSGDKLITVVPNIPAHILGKILLPIQGSGKVKEGQRVNIKFINYPYMEYGMVRGVIKSISLLASNNNYSVEVELPDGLKTNYGKTLDFNQEMQGTAEIITEDIRLIERFFNPIKSLLKR
jgi:HlyD family secretion protein